MRKLFVLAAMTLSVGAYAQVGAERDVLPALSLILPAGVASGRGLLAASEGKGDQPRLAPRGLDGASRPGAPPAGQASPTLRIEFLALLPAPAGGAPPRAQTLSILALAAASPSSLAGLDYWSASRGRMRTLYETAQRVRSKEDQRPLADPASLGDLGQGPPWKAYALLEDLTFGRNLYAFEIDQREGWVSLEIVNEETVRYLFLPLAKPGAMRTRIAASPCAEGLLVYFESVVKDPGFGAQRVFESAGNKGLAVLGWFAGKAAALGLASPVAMPRKIEEAL